jgi:hypothetical protein
MPDLHPPEIVALSYGAMGFRGKINYLMPRDAVTAFASPLWGHPHDSGFGEELLLFRIVFSRRLL